MWAALLPERLSHGSVGRSLPTEVDRATLSSQFLEVPLDHFGGSTSPSWSLKFFVDDASFKPGGIVLVTMPSEAPTGGCGGGALAKALNAVAVCSQHRYFGDSVPLNDSTTAALSRYLSVEQNLADVASLITHVRTRLYPSASATVVMGGSYAGASSAWMRHTYPHLVDAAIAYSPPINAVYDFAAYDTSNLVALSSPDSRCAQAQARVAEALTTLLAKQPAQLLDLFGAAHYLRAGSIGLTDFMYALSDSSASAVQYGRKQMLCDALRPAFAGGALAGGAPAGGAGAVANGPTGAGEAADADAGAAGGAMDALALARLFANYTRQAWGPRYFSSCFYNSTCMRDATRGAVAQSARSWYWLKCSQLGYFQTSPPAGLATRPRGLTVARLLEQCAYIFGAAAPLVTPARIDGFNRRMGGEALGGASRIFEIDFSDDPWKMATTTSLVARQAWVLSAEQPFLLLTCDGCGHCGSGAPKAKAEAIERQAVDYLSQWGLAPRRTYDAPSSSSASFSPPSSPSSSSPSFSPSFSLSVELPPPRTSSVARDEERAAAASVEVEAGAEVEAEAEAEAEAEEEQEPHPAPPVDLDTPVELASAYALPSLAAPGPAGLHIAPHDPRISYHGRWSFDYPPAAGAAACAWPMSGFSFTVDHSVNCSARLTAPGDGARLLVKVDGAVTQMLTTNVKAEPTAWYVLASGLDPSRAHLIEVYKVTEDNARRQPGTPPGTLLLHGLSLPRGG